MQFSGMQIPSKLIRGSSRKQPVREFINSASFREEIFHSPYKFLVSIPHRGVPRPRAPRRGATFDPLDPNRAEHFRHRLRDATPLLADRGLKPTAIVQASLRDDVRGDFLPRTRVRFLIFDCSVLFSLGYESPRPFSHLFRAMRLLCFLLLLSLGANACADDLDVLIASGTSASERGAIYQRLSKAYFPKVAGKFARLMGSHPMITGIGPEDQTTLGRARPGRSRPRRLHPRPALECSSRKRTEEGCGSIDRPHALRRG